MPSRVWQTLSVLAVMLLPTGVYAQNYQELSAMVTGPWHHVPDVRSTLEFNREMAKCQVVSAQTPVNSTTPAVVEIVRWRVLINCLAADGYEPGAPQHARNVASKENRTVPTVKVAGKGPGIQPCSQFNASRSDENEEHVFFSWADGFLTGYNIQAKAADMVELSALTEVKQFQFLQDYCDQHPDKRYIEAVLALIQTLRSSTASK